MKPLCCSLAFRPKNAVTSGHLVGAMLGAGEATHPAGFCFALNVARMPFAIFVALLSRLVHRVQAVILHEFPESPSVALPFGTVDVGEPHRQPSTDHEARTIGEPVVKMAASAHVLPALAIGDEHLALACGKLGLLDSVRWSWWSSSNDGRRRPCLRAGGVIVWREMFMANQVMTYEPEVINYKMRM